MFSWAQSFEWIVSRISWTDPSSKNSSIGAGDGGSS
jgi:hypothetical protein